MYLKVYEPCTVPTRTCFQSNIVVSDSMLVECSEAALVVLILIVHSEDIINGNRNLMIFSQKC